MSSDGDNDTKKRNDKYEDNGDSPRSSSSKKESRYVVFIHINYIFLNYTFERIGMRNSLEVFIMNYYVLIIESF